MNRYVRYALAGLGTGITGAIAMLAWFALASLWSRQSAWWVPNLTAAAFYGDASVTNRAGGYTIVGIAMILFAYGSAGFFFGILVKEYSPRMQLLSLSLLVALVIHFLLLRFFWKGADPIAGLYAPDTQILFAHLIFGWFLARYPRVLNQVSR